MYRLSTTPKHLILLASTAVLPLACSRQPEGPTAPQAVDGMPWTSDDSAATPEKRAPGALSVAPVPTRASYSVVASSKPAGTSASVEAPSGSGNVEALIRGLNPDDPVRGPVLLKYAVGLNRIGTPEALEALVRANDAVSRRMGEALKAMAESRGDGGSLFEDPTFRADGAFTAYYARSVQRKTAGVIPDPSPVQHDPGTLGGAFPRREPRRCYQCRSGWVDSIGDPYSGAGYHKGHPCTNCNGSGYVSR